VFVRDEKLEDTSLRLEASETDRLLTAATRLVLASTHVSTDKDNDEFDPFDDPFDDDDDDKLAEIAFNELPRAMAYCAVC
jgi:hypothetical protein